MGLQLAGIHFEGGEGKGREEMRARNSDGRMGAEAAQWDERLREGISMLPYLMSAAAPIQNADWRREEKESRGNCRGSVLGVLGGNLADANINGRRTAGRRRREGGR